MKKSIGLPAFLLTTAIVFGSVTAYTFFLSRILDILPHFLLMGPPKLIIIFFFSLFFASTAIVLLMERNDPGRTTAWLLVLLVFPVIGFLIYLFLGSRIIKKRRSRLKRLKGDAWRQPNLPNQGKSELIEALALKMSRLLISTCDCYPTASNDIKVLNNGNDIFQAMLEAMSKAQHHIHLETYIFREDHIGRHFIQVMAEKAAAGVKVRLITDGIGSFALKSHQLQAIREKGIDIQIFFPVRFTLLRNKINYRNHRKILVVDGHTGFVGGANIGDDYLGLYPQVGNWRDTHLQIKGPASAYLQRIFLHDWFYLTKYKEIQDLEAYFPFPGAVAPAAAQLSPQSAHQSVPQPAGDAFMQIAASGPDTQWQSIMQAYYLAIAGAASSIRLTTPYFIPNETILTGLKTAALSGIKVQILLPQNPDHKLVFWAAHSYFHELLAAGIEIYLYQDGFLHAKVMTVDSSLAIVGTANMDQRSFSLNFEVSAIVYDAKTVEKLNDDFNEDLAKARLLDLADFENRSNLQQLLDAASRLLSPIL